MEPWKSFGKVVINPNATTEEVVATADEAIYELRDCQGQIPSPYMPRYELEELRYLYNELYVLRPGEDYFSSKDVEPLVINQGFRSYQVMLKMKDAGLNPSETSNHMRGCAVDIRCMGVEHALRMMTILLDMADTSRRDFDELFLERRGTVYWLHLAARPKNNRRKIGFIMK